MRDLTWNVVGSHALGADNVFLLATAPESMRAEIRVNGESVRITFSSTARRGAQSYACAEAARFYAELLDTIGDMEMTTDEPLQISEPEVFGHEVTVKGPDALTCAACYFGNVVAEAVL